jgi:hypothetical protein
VAVEPSIHPTIDRQKRLWVGRVKLRRPVEGGGDVGGSGNVCSATTSMAVRNVSGTAGGDRAPPIPDYFQKPKRFFRKNRAIGSNRDD